MAKYCGHYDEATISGRLVGDVLKCPDCLLSDILAQRAALQSVYDISGLLLDKTTEFDKRDLHHIVKIRKIADEFKFRASPPPHPQVAGVYEV